MTIPLAPLAGQGAAPLLRATARRRRHSVRRAGAVAAATATAMAAVAAGALGSLPQIDQQVATEQTSAAATADIPPAYLAAYQRAAAAANPSIPWVILAAVGKVATDHGRLSPYDGTIRQGTAVTSYPEVSPPIAASPTSPPLSGPGPTGGSGPDTELATDVDALPVFLVAERQVESGGDYTATNGGASGAYQFVDATWGSEAASAGYQVYARGPAAAAPPAVQDAVAGYDARRLFAQLHSWYWAAEAWYYPLWAADPSEQGAVPYPRAGNTLTMATYAQKVYAAMQAATGRAPPPPAPRPATSTATGTAATGTASTGTGPLLLTPSVGRVPGADLQAVDTEAELLADRASGIEEQTWRRLGLPSSIVDQPLSEPGAQRFWTEVLARLPVAGGVGIEAVATGDDGYLPPSLPPAAPPPPPSGGSISDKTVAAGGDPMARFSADLLANLGAPPTPDNVAAIQAWASGEASAAAFNPLDTTQVEPGATPYNTNGGSPVESYPDYRTGLAATVATLEPGGHPAPAYQAVLTALQAGHDLGAIEAAISASPWGTHRFPDPRFPATANFPGRPASMPSGPGPLHLADLATQLPQTADGTVHAGTDAQAPTDELTMAEYYAGVIAKPTPAAGRQYAPTTTVAAGYAVPAGSPAPVATAVRMALAQLGKPYVFGATGPASFDCSGLVMAAYATAGVALPRTTYAQVLAGRAVPTGDPSQLRAGDLLFIMGSDPQGSAPGHVGVYVGAGEVVDAPYTGAVVHVSPLAAWMPQLVAVRRVVG